MIVKGDLEKLEVMLGKLQDMPALDGMTPRQIHQENVQESNGDLISR
jgi:hypothetical protein